MIFLGMTYLLNNIVLLQYTQYCNNNKHATPESSSKQLKTAEGKSLARHNGRIIEIRFRLPESDHFR